LKNESENSILAIFRQYEKNAGLEGIEFLIHPDSFNGPSLLDFLYDEETGESSDFKVIVNKDYLNNPTLALSMCHELGHIKKIKQGVNRKFIEPHTTWQWIVAEVSADREAFKIYGKPRRSDIFRWLAKKVLLTTRNLLNPQYKSFIGKQLVIGIVRLLAASMA
jgi:hypothetical protein